MKNYVEETIKNTIEKNKLINRGDHIVLGLSGGPDSMCLLFALMNLSDKAGFTIEAVHINHKFRPGAAEEDQEYVESICEKHGIKCTSFVYDCTKLAKEEGLTLEEAGRKVRYESFDKAAKQNKGNVKIAVAQNMDDQCETMLFRLMRGTGPDGLCGIRYMRYSEGGYPVIRPLLDVERKYIEEYCIEKDLKPRIDHTNSQAIYTRNRIRLELIPYIEKNFNPEFKKSLVRLSENLNDDREYFEKAQKEAFEKASDKNGFIVLSEYEKFEKPVRHRVLREALLRKGIFENISKVHIDQIDSLFLKGKTSKKIQLPGGFTLRTEYGKLVIEDEKDVNLHENGKMLSAFFSKEELLKTFGTVDYEIRKRKPGDYIYISEGRKKLKDLFIDIKLPKEKRDDIRLVAIGNEILWIPGIRYSSRYRGKDTGDDSLKVEIFVNM